PTYSPNDSISPGERSQIAASSKCSSSSRIFGSHMICATVPHPITPTRKRAIVQSPSDERRTTKVENQNKRVSTFVLRLSSFVLNSEASQELPARPRVLQRRTPPRKRHQHVRLGDDPASVATRL